MAGLFPGFIGAVKIGSPPDSGICLSLATHGKLWGNIGKLSALVNMKMKTNAGMRCFPGYTLASFEEPVLMLLGSSVLWVGVDKIC